MITTDRAERGAKESCADFEWMVGPWVDGELPRGEGAGLEAHLAECSGCRGLAESLRRFDHLARAAHGPLPKVSSREWGELWHDIESRLPAMRAPRIVGGRTWLVPLLSAAAVVALGVWLGWTLVREGGARTPAAGPPVAGTPLEGAPKEIENVRTIDGIEVKFRSDENGHFIEYNK